MNSMPGEAAHEMRRRAPTLLRALAGLLVVAAILLLGAAVWPSSGLGLMLAALALIIAAALCWRINRHIRTSFDQSRILADIGRLRAMLSEREATWSAVPAPAAAWDSRGQLLFATVAWHGLGLPTDAPPTQPELAIGEPPRVFVVETTEQPSGTRLAVLREVTRERQALQAKDELLAILSHEMRTPLSSIRGYGQLMARQLATVQEQVQRLDLLIGDVLDTAGADTGRLKLHREPLSIRSVVTSACERFHAAHPSRTLDNHVDADALIEGDAARLGQIMDNLLSNAAKYSTADSPITVRTYLEDEWVRIAVRDRGIGVAAEHLPRLFDRFYRVPGGDVAGGPHGFGLGLSIVRDLVEAHGGRVEVSSDGPGTGATFTVALPAALALQPEAAASTADHK